MPSPLKDITTKAADTWAEWMIPEECTIKAEDIKAEFLKTDVFMTTADAIREDKVPTAATTTTAADIKAGFKTTTKISAKLRPFGALFFLPSNPIITRMISIIGQFYVVKQANNLTVTFACHLLIFNGFS